MECFLFQSLNKSITQVKNLLKLRCKIHPVVLGEGPFDYIVGVLRIAYARRAAVCVCMIYKMK